MDDINKDLVSYTMEQEDHFTAKAPMLFGNEFMKNVTEHWESPVEDVGLPINIGFSEGLLLSWEEESVSL